MKSEELIDGYRWENADQTCAHNYLFPALEKLALLNFEWIKRHEG
jgi:hypothetical protein